MRPIKITMSGFGPYAGEISLNMGDFGEKGLYLITGDTGAGKTTIFDGICFALYGEASGGSREASMLRSKYAAPETPTFVELTFFHAGKEYYIKRNPEYMRPAKRGDGEKKELPNAELHMPDGKVITKVRDVNNAVVELLGIDRDQFSQIAMLAQGDFQKLLLADTKERQEIFRKLFRTQYFQTLQSRLEEERRKSYGLCEDAKKSANQYISGIKCSETNPLIIEADKAKAGELFVEDVLELIDKLISEDTAIREKATAQIEALEKELEAVNQNIGKAKQLEKAASDLKEAEDDLKKELLRQQELDERLTEATKALAGKEEYQKQFARIEAELPRYKEYDEASAGAKKLSAAIQNTNKEISASLAKEQEILEMQKKLQKELELYKDVGIGKEKLLSEEKNLSARKESFLDIKEKAALLKKEERNLDRARKNYMELDLKYREKNSRYEHLFKLYRDGQAGVLAATLEEGKPCPVCGSLLHPSPAGQAAEVPTDAELKEAKAEADKARDNAETASRKCGELGSSFDTNLKNVHELCNKLGLSDVKVPGAEEGKEAQLEKLIGTIEDELIKVSDSIERLQVQIKEEERRLKRKAEIERDLPGFSDELNKTKEIGATMKEKLAGDTSALEALQRQMELLKDSFTFEGQRQAEEKMLELKKKAAEIQSSFDNADSAMKAYIEHVNQIRGRIKGLQETMDKSDAVNLDLELEKKNELEASRAEQNLLYTGANSRIEANKTAKAGIEKKQKELSEAEKKLSMVAALSDTASGKLSGKEKIMLETYIQTTYFDRIIARANLRFMKMSDAQYELKRMETAANNKGQSGLDLGVIDHYNGTQRSVRTLSGGESFMAALSLALGLSDEIQSLAGGIQIDTMFVDEGFGTLDSDALELAYNALAGLTEGNRLVGIISHVAELKSKIDRQIVVTKERSGGSRAEIKI